MRMNGTGKRKSELVWCGATCCLVLNVLPSQGATPSGREFYEAYYGKSSTAAAAEAKRFGMGESTAGELATVNSMNSTKSPGSTAHVRTYTKQLLACLRSEMGPELKELVSSVAVMKQNLSMQGMDQSLMHLSALLGGA
eukprot:1158318-Pelagomonas_calceolata.AAC.3